MLWIIYISQYGGPTNLTLIRTHFWSVVQHSSIHPLVREKPDAFATKIGHEVHAVGVLPRGAEFPHSIRIKTVLATYLEAARTKGVRLWSCETLRVLLDYEGLD